MAPSFCQHLPLLIVQTSPGYPLLRTTFVINNSAETLPQTTILTSQGSPNSSASLLLCSLQPVDALGLARDWYLVQRCSSQLLGVEKMKTFYSNLWKQAKPHFLASQEMQFGQGDTLRKSKQSFLQNTKSAVITTNYYHACMKLSS